MDSEGNSGRMTVFIERPTMSFEMWEGLKRHIMRDREKKKQEAVERELELKRQQELEEVKRELAQLEKKLQDLKDEKHLYFVKLKQVLQEEEEDRRRALELAEARAAVAATHNYANTKCFASVCGQPGQPSYIQSGALAPYMMAIPQSTSTAGAYSSSLKRRQSPSPYPSSPYQVGYQTSPPTYKPRLIAHGNQHIPDSTLAPSSAEGSRAYYGAHYNTSGNDCPGRQSTTAEIAYPSSLSTHSPSPTAPSFTQAGYKSYQLTQQKRVTVCGSQQAPHPTAVPLTTQVSPVFYGACHNVSCREYPGRLSTTDGVAYSSHFASHSTRQLRDV